MYARTYTQRVEVDWDPDKADAHGRKHRVSFADAAIALEDPNALTIRDDHAGELRYVTLGLDAEARLLVVVYTMRSQRVRLISARRATAAERRQYAE